MSRRRATSESKNIPRSYSETKQHADELETVLAVQQAITSRLEVSSVLQLIADAARRLTNTHLSLVYLRHGEELRVAALSAEAEADLFVGYRAPIDQSVAGLTIQAQRPVIVNDTAGDPRIYQGVVEPLRIRCYMTVPLLSEAGPIGVIAVANEEPGTLGLDEERILTMLAPSAVIGLENARLYQEEHDRRQEADRRREIAESLREVLAILNSNRPFTEILNDIAAQAKRLLGSEAVAIYQLNKTTKRLSIKAAQGLPEAFITHADIQADQNLLDQVLLTHQPVVVPDINAVLGGAQLLPVDSQQFQRLADKLPQLYRAVLAMPLIIKGEVYGSISLFYVEPRDFSEEEIRLAATFCDQAALAVENARLQAQVEETAITAERHRLARDLHDAVSQTLFSASIIADVLPRIWKIDPSEAERSLEKLRQLTRGALAEMRTLLLELRPAALTETKLDTLLGHLSEALAGRTGIAVTSTLAANCLLPPEVQVTFYRIAQEALTNIAKHAAATRVTLSLRCVCDQVFLTIRDDGRGFDLSSVSADRLGVGIMRERAKLIQATFQLESQPGAGTQVNLIWPGEVERNQND